MNASVVLLSIDDLRFDALSCVDETTYVGKHGLSEMRETPTLDAVVTEGVRFERAFSTSSYTPTAHASMLTGLLPPNHHVRSFMINGLDPSITTIASTLGGEGYRTVASLDVAPMFKLLGLAQGFDEVIHANDDDLFRTLAAGEQPVFLFAHFEDVHPPVRESLCPPTEDYNDDFYTELYDVMAGFGVTPDEGTDRRDAAVAASGKLRRFLESEGMVAAAELPRYLAGVNKFDRGRLSIFLDRLTSTLDLDETLLIITSDHGQGTIPSARLADRSIPQKFDHGEALLEELIRVPLIVRGPGVKRGATSPAIVSLTDIAPTVADFADVEGFSSDGRPLQSAFAGSQVDDSVAYAEVWYHDRGELSRYLHASVTQGRLLSEGYETFLQERTVRSGYMKLVERGGPFPEAHSLTDEVFVEELWRRYRARVPRSDEVRVVAEQLRSGIITRDELLSRWSRSAVGRRSLFHVGSDPWEEVDLLVQDVSLAASGISRGMREVADELVVKLDRVDRMEVRPQTGETGLTAAEMVEVEGRLRDLGYIE